MKLKLYPVNRVNTLLLFLIVNIALNEIVAEQLPLLKISQDQKYIITEEGKPFFWLGGTAWELFHRLTKEEVDLYLCDRAKKGFTVIQATILAEMDELAAPNAYGELPLFDKDPTQINEKYFEHVDYAIRKAEELGLYIGLLPTWGKYCSNDGIFTPTTAEIYAKTLAQRYLNQTNIIWILGGDLNPKTEDEKIIIRALAKGIRNIDQQHLITYHPSGNKRAEEYFDEDWLDFDMFQTGHTRERFDYNFVYASKNSTTKRPVINGEPKYEDHPNRFKPVPYGWLDDTDVRVSAYWTMLSGAAGYTYGCHDIWQFFSKKYTAKNGARTHWKEALQLPGSKQMRFMKELFIKLPWQDMINDQSCILNENPKDPSYILCAVSNNKEFMILYTPLGNPINVDLSQMSSNSISAFWYNPRDGYSTFIGKFSSDDKPIFDPWSKGRGSDFILVLMDSDSNYCLPKRE